MMQYNNLLSNISQELGVGRGSSESIEQWKARIIYSLLGRMAYASLFDSYDEVASGTLNDEPMSITHFKRRVKKLFDTYLEMYSEVRTSFSITGDYLCENIYDIYSKTGYLYHKPNRICASTPCSSEVGGVRFERGMPLNRHIFMSGLGFYTLVEEIPVFFSSLRTSLAEMFDLPTMTLTSQWTSLIASAQWRRIESNTGMQFLREEPPYQSGYWLNTPSAKDKDASVCRSVTKGSILYYLYQQTGGDLLISPLPVWLVDDPHFGVSPYYIVNCCLASHRNLPPINYHLERNIVRLSCQYLLPLPELYLIKLYSWPVAFSGLTENFHRTLNVSVFSAIKVEMEKIGYTFVEV